MPEGKGKVNGSNAGMLNTEQDSIYYEYYENQIVKSKSLFRNGERYGLYESYWQNGDVYGRVMYEDGLRKGFYENFDSLSQKLLRRVEFVKDPIESIGIGSVDYVNRIWHYIEGDTNTISTSSTVYKITPDTLNEGLKFSFHFSLEHPEDGVFEKFSIVLGALNNLEALNSPDTTIEMLSNDNKQSFDYVFSEEDVKKGYVAGAIVANDIYEVEGGKKQKDRLLFFRWNIKESELENHLIGN